MQLIDALEVRSDSVKIVEGAEEIQAQCDDSGSWSMVVDGASYSITDGAFDTLMNHLRIPIKYIHRCTDDDGRWLAEQSINYWLAKYGDFSFLIEDLTVTQVFPGKRLYLPGVRVNDLIIDYLNGDVTVQSFAVKDDVFNAVYITEDTVEVLGKKLNLGVRVLYSDCFVITPRFDGVIYDKETGSLLGWPTLGRKFRVASNTIPQVVDQIEEFIDLSLEGLRNTLIPALEQFGFNEFREKDHRLVAADQFISRLCNDLRYSRKVRDELIKNCTVTPNHLPLEIVEGIGAYTTKDRGAESHIDLGMARDLQIALSYYIVRGTFK